jgi:hypothetical protein
MAPPEASHPVLSQQLLLHVAEELKLPLQQIARQAELGLLTGENNLNIIQNTADMAMRLLDNYAFGIKLAIEPEQLIIEPVSVSSVLYDSCQELNGLAKRYGVQLDLDIGGRYGPVMANRLGLQSALVSLGAAIIEALPAIESNQLTLHLATHRSRYGIVAGVYTDSNRLTSVALDNGRKLHGKSRQPFLNMTHTSGAGIFVADHIMRAMHLKLRSSRHNNLYGLGTVLQPNPQMQLV